MKKRTLLSLLAIPIFSAVTTFNAFSQNEEVSAGVIDFLLANPKTANKMKPSQGVALNIISDFLKTQGQRKHNIEYANAGKDQITINTNDGRQAQFVKDGSGNMFLVVDGVIYPIARELINQASNIPNTNNSTLPPYNSRYLESSFKHNPKEDISQFYAPQKGGEYLSDIARKFGVPALNVRCWPTFKNGRTKSSPIKNLKILKNKTKLRISHGYGSLYIIKEKYKNEISAVFSYKWHQDLNSDNLLGFNEFKQIKRTFSSAEDFKIAIDYQTEKDFKGKLEVKIFEDHTGELVYKKEKIVPSGLGVYHGTSIPAGNLPIGVYIINVNLINDNSSPLLINNTLSSKSEKFEIIQSTSKTKK